MEVEQIKIPDLKAERVHVKDIKPYIANNKEHPPEQIAVIRESVKKFGFRWPLLLSDRKSKSVVCGHGRLLAAIELNMSELPCYFAEDMSAEEIKAFRIMDNKSNESGWIFGAIKSEFESLQDTGFDLSLTGFSQKEIDDILKSSEQGVIGEDDFEPPKEAKYKVKRGDVYELGEHLLMCGDSTCKGDVSTLTGDDMCNLVVTSPPYWVGKDYEYQKNKTEVIEFIKDCCECMCYVTNQDEGRIIINTGNGLARSLDDKASAETIMWMSYYIDFLRKHGWLMRHQRIWVKSGGLPASIGPKTDVIDQHCEFISTFWNPNGKQRGMERLSENWIQQGYWDFKGQMSSEGHVAAYPVELPARNIKAYSKKGEFVFDPFGGSGSTLIACEQLGRKCFMMELDCYYCSVIIERFEKLTGKEAKKC